MKPVPDMIYNVFSGTLNPTQSINREVAAFVVDGWAAVPSRLVPALLI